MTENRATDARPPFFSIEETVVDDYGLNPLAGWLYVVIVRHINRKKNDAFPSVSRLAKLANMSTRSVIRYTKVLEDKGLIFVTREKDDIGENQVNHYQLLIATRVVSEKNEVVTDSHYRDGTQSLPVVSDVAHNQKNLNQKKLTREEQETRAPSKSKPEYGFKVDLALVEQGGGLLQYSDGSTLVNGDRAALAQAALKIFTVYLETMRQLGRAPLGKDETQWNKHQEAALNLALARTDPEQVARYIVAQYRGDDAFWRQLGAPMKLQHIAEHLPAWTQSKTPPPSATSPAYTAPSALREAMEADHAT